MRGVKKIAALPTVKIKATRCHCHLDTLYQTLKSNWNNYNKKKMTWKHSESMLKDVSLL